MSDGDQRILVVAEARQGELRDISFELVSAAGGLKAPARAQVQVVVIDPQAEALAPAFALDDVDEILAVPVQTAGYEAHVWERALEEVLAAERPTVVLAGFTVDSMGFAPSLAARHTLGFASDVAAVAWDDGLRASRGAYGDKLVAELAFRGGIARC